MANPIGTTLQLVGDRWTLLVLREAFRGARRFGDFQDRLGIAASVLTTRLGNLVDDGLLTRQRYSDAPPRDAYRLTEDAKALWPLFVAIWTWNRTWVPPEAWTEQATLHHDGCGARILTPVLADGACGAVGVTAHDTRAERPPALTFAEANPPRRYRRTSRAADQSGDDEAVMDASALLGDRWSTSVLAAAHLGARRWSDFTTEVEGIPPRQLSDRLATFERQDVLARAPVRDGARRMQYRLTDKGLAFLPVFATLLDWGRRWRPGPSDRTLMIVHGPCGAPLDPAWTCDACGDVLRRREIRFVE